MAEGDIFKLIFRDEQFCILIWISLKYVPEGAIDNKLLSIGSDDGLAPNSCQAVTTEPMLTQSTDAYMRHYEEMGYTMGFTARWLKPEMCSERDSPLEPFVLPAPGQPELARLICDAHLGPPVLTRKQKRPRVNSLVCDRMAAFCAAGPPEVLSRMSRPVTQAAERERELARARSQRLKQAAPSLPGESVSRGFADRGALEGYPSHYTSLLKLR